MKMKKIITSVVAVVLLFTMVFSMASCSMFGFGSVDMDELAATLRDLKEKDYIVTGVPEEDEDVEDISESVLKVYTVTEVETGKKLTVTQYANKDIAKAAYDLAKFNQDMEEKYEASQRDQKKYYKLQLKYYEALDEVGEEGADDMLEKLEENPPSEDVLIRKGDVVIQGSKDLYKEFI